MCCSLVMTRGAGDGFVSVSIVPERETRVKEMEGEGARK